MLCGFGFGGHQVPQLELRLRYVVSLPFTGAPVDKTRMFPFDTKRDPRLKRGFEEVFFYFPGSPQKGGLPGSKQGFCSGGGIKAANNRSYFKTGI